MLMMIRCVVGVVWRTAWEGSESNMCEVNWTENRRERNSILKCELSWAFISVCLLMCHQDYSPDEKGHIYVFTYVQHTHTKTVQDTSLKCIQRYIVHFHMWCCCKIFNFCWDHMDVLLNEFLKGKMYELGNKILQFISRKSLNLLNLIKRSRICENTLSLLLYLFKKEVSLQKN